MKRRGLLRALGLLFVLLFAGAALAQVSTISIPAGTDEDKAIQAITNEQDAQKRAALLQEMADKFAANPNAVAYAYSQLSQQALAAGDAAQALAYGEKALAAQPNNLELIVIQVNAAQQLKNYEKVAAYAAQGGKAFQGIGKEPKPEGESAEAFAQHSEDARNAARPSYEYLENAAYYAVANQADAHKRMAEVEQFQAAFPGSRFQAQISQLAVYALQEMQEWPRLFEYGEKLVAADPNNFATLSLLAEAYAEDPKSTHLAKAAEYARKAVELAKPDDPSADQPRKLSAGLAYSALGYVLMKQSKMAQAAVELKKGADLLEGNPSAYAMTLFRLANAYSLLGRYSEARNVLVKAIAIPGPYQQPSRDLLEKVKAKVLGKR